jgi:hypothetical protein
MNNIKKSRINLTGEIGVSILRLAIQRKLNWIIRDIRETDVGIDANVEQVVNGNPTAKYISVQLKTGLGNVETSPSGDFYFYFKETHYQYWLSSSIPVIIVLCDPSTDTLYWSQIAERTINKTPKGYRLIIHKTSQITESTKIDFDDIISTYQGECLIPDDFNNWAIEEKLEYSSKLMDECSGSLAQIRAHIDKLDAEIKKVIEKGEDFQNNHSIGYTKEECSKFISKISVPYSTQLNICKTRINKEYPISIETHIVAIRLMEEVLAATKDIKRESLKNLQEEVQNEISQIKSTITQINEVSNNFRNNNMLKNATSAKAERSLALILDDYAANLNILCGLLNELC